MKKNRLMITLLLFSIIIVGCVKTEEVDAPQTEKTTVRVTTVAPKETTTKPTTKETTTAIPEPAVDPHEGMVQSPLSGIFIEEELAKVRPIAVTISDIKAALPQSGISEAEVIYETLAEGGIPRLVAVFQNFEGEKIGPIRSARHYFLDFAFDFDAVYVHYGKSPQAYKAFSDLNSPNLDGMNYYDGTLSYQDPNRRRPHASFTTKEMLYNTAKKRGYRVEKDEKIPNKFDFVEEEREIDTVSNIANKVELEYSYYITSTFDYDANEKIYYHSQYGDKHIDVVNDEQLSCKNIIVQLTNIWAIKGDEAGRLDMELIGSGTGYYITNGKYEEITWKKESHRSPTKYFTSDGQALLINPGKTWISVFPSYNAGQVRFLGEEE